MSKYVHNLLDHRVIVGGSVNLYPGCFVEISDAEAEDEKFTSLVTLGLVKIIEDPEGKVNEAPASELVFASDDPAIKGYDAPPLPEKTVAEAPVVAAPIVVEDISTTTEAAPVVAETPVVETAPADDSVEEDTPETETDGTVVAKKRGRKPAATAAA